jgi:hypothetical protein
MGIWHKDFYIITPEGEKLLRQALNDSKDGVANRADVQKCLDELNGIPEDRCHVSRDQKKFLERMLGEREK